VTNPRFSIVTPAFNAQTTLGRALKSVLAQTRGDWEAIIIDDGSMDATSEIASKWASFDSRVRVFRQSNAGASAARTAGVAHASGEWVIFLDSDDTLDRRYLALMSKPAERDPAVGAVCCGYVRIGADGRRTAVYPAPQMNPDPFLVCARATPTCIHGFMVKRQIIQEVGSFDASLATSEDWDLWIRVARAGTNFAVVRKSLAHYWDSNSSSLTKARTQLMRDSFIVMKRARSRDPRVANPALQYANGAALGGLMAGLLSCAIWNAGALIGKGLDGRILLEEIEPSPALAAAATGVSGWLLDGLIIGAQCRLSDLVGIWPRLQPSLVAFLEAVATKMRDVALKDRLLRAVEIDVLTLGDFRSGVRLTRTQGVILTPRILLRGFTPPGDTDLVVFRFPALSASRVLSTPVVMFGPITGRELRVLIRRRFEGKLLQKLLTNSRTRFATVHLWLAAAALHKLTSRFRRRAATRIPLSETLIPRSFRAYLSSIKSRMSPPETIATAIPHYDAASDLETPVASSIVWNDAIRTRLELMSQSTFTIPVLRYHRIACEGPEDRALYRLEPSRFEHQLRFLRRRGFRSISPADWMKAANNRPMLRGRPTILTFDGAYLDFLEIAWPLIVRNGFSAHVFVPTGKVGSVSDWDFGEPAPLMNWNQIAYLSEQGVTFGSHLRSYTAADLMSSEELLHEAVSSRAELEAATRSEVRTVAPPFGAMDARTEQILGLAGYTQVFTDRGNEAPVARASLYTPRIAINGFDTIELFARKLGLMSEPPELADQPGYTGSRHSHT
jgi:glycosyltransferase involved in cell wall biosynthesis/peptidoglycan/xylan/chitin deacetylase (PgdA/CDA1 family)